MYLRHDCLKFLWDQLIRCDILVPCANKLHTQTHTHEFVALTFFFWLNLFRTIAFRNADMFHSIVTKTKPFSKIFKCSENVSYIFNKTTFRQNIFIVYINRKIFGVCDKILDKTSLNYAIHLDRDWLKFYLMHIGTMIRTD